MASESILRSRRSLVWETKEISKCQRDSPVFSLMDSNWILQLNPFYCPTKFFATSFNIKLKQCSGIQSFQPFEVVTLMVDRRNNVQMHCSKLFVSSSCETLFKASFDTTYEKLPGLKLYDDIAIVCTFYPSTGLALSMQTIKGSSLRIRHSIVWKTGKPLYQSKESPLFNLKNSKWKLQVHLTNSTQYRSPLYQICLKNSSGTHFFEPFDIETFLVDRKNFVQIRCSRLTVSSTSEILYKSSTDSIYNELPGLKLSDEITIVCAFGPPIGSALNEKMENDIAATIECFQYRNPGNCFQDNVSKKFSSNLSSSLKISSDFEDLSNDFSSLLDNSYMPDIKLKSGDDIIPAHKFVLAARSTVFSTMLKKEVVESDVLTLEIKDIEPSVLREFLKYLYSGKISFDLSEDMICNLYTTSDNYSVPSLRKICSSYMSKNINTENFIKFLILADAHNDQELVDTISCFISEETKLLLTDNWINFSKQFPRLANEMYRLHMMKTLKISPLKDP